MTRDASLGADRSGQSHVVGVAILLGITTLSLGVLTAGIGTVVEGNAAAADAHRVADGMRAIRPAETTGLDRDPLSFSSGTLRVEPRTLRVLDGGGVIATHQIDALTYATGDRRVAFLSGAVVRGGPGNAWIVRAPSIASSTEVLVVGVSRLNATGSTAVSGTGGGTVTIRTDVTHDRRSLGPGRYRLAVETATPTAWERLFADRGVPTDRRDFDGDGVPSVVASYPGERALHLVVHDLRMAVTP